MKKALTVLASALLLAVVVPRPASAEVTFDLGIKGGISLAKVVFSGGGPEEALCSLNKPVFGAFFAFNLSPSFAIQPEIYLLTQGGTYEEEDEFVYKAELLFSYIHIPVLAKFRIIKEGTIRPIIFAGPALGLLTKAVDKYYEDGVLQDEMDVKEYLSDTNFSLVFGGGLEVILNKTMLVLDIRYDLGLADIDAKSDTTTMKTKALMIMAGIGF